MSTDPVVWTEPAGGSMSEVVSTFTHAVSAEVPEEVKEVAGHMTMDEVVALGIAVACLLSLAWTLLSAPVIRALRATCLKDLLLKIEIAAEMRAQQAAMEHASAATDAASKQVAAKQAKAANILKAIGSSGPPSPPKGKGAAAKKGGASPAPPPPPPSQPAPPAELRGSKYDLGKYAPELLTAERSAIEAAKAELDAKLKGASAQPTMAIDKSAPKKPRVGVRGHGKGARSRATLVYPGDGVYEGEYVDGLKDVRSAVAGMHAVAHARSACMCHTPSAHVAAAPTRRRTRTRCHAHTRRHVRTRHAHTRRERRLPSRAHRCMHAIGVRGLGAGAGRGQVLLRARERVRGPMEE